MKIFFEKAGTYVRNNPKLIISIFAILSLLMFTTIIMSIVCPPSVMAIGIGVWSLVGNILPLIGFGSWAIFTLGTFIALSTPAPVKNDFAQVLKGMIAISQVQSPAIVLHSLLETPTLSSKSTPQNQSEVKNFDSVLVSIDNSKTTPQEEEADFQLQTSGNK